MKVNLREPYDEVIQRLIQHWEKSQQHEGRLKRRWFEFRIGHGTYIVFITSLANFMLMSYRSLRELVAILQEIISNLFNC